MSRLVQATCRYLFLVFGPGPDRIGVSSPQTTRARMISARMVLFAAATAAAARASRGVQTRFGWPGAGHRPEDIRAPLDRDVVHHHQEHAPGLEVQPVRHGARRAPGFRRGTRDMHLAARALHLMPVVLDGLRV